MRKLLTVLALCAGAPMGLQAQTIEPGSLVISGTSTVRDWTCATRNYTIDIIPVEGYVEGVLAAEKAVESVDIAFTVRDIECGHEKMNEHMARALRAEDHPIISFTLSAYDLERAENGIDVTATGMLTIAGTTRPVEMAVVVTRDAAGGLNVRGTQGLAMTHFDVEPPSLMFGAIKVADDIAVSFDVPLATTNSN